MRAAVYYETGGPEVFRFEEVPDPVAGPGDVLVQVQAISIEGGDTLNRLGGVLSGTPHIVGYQCAGTVVSVGGEVTTVRPGDRVVTVGVDGSHRGGGLRPGALRHGRRRPVRVRAPAAR
jgi:NADPH2:quinone reductase